MRKKINLGTVKVRRSITVRTSTKRTVCVVPQNITGPVMHADIMEERIIPAIEKKEHTKEQLNMLPLEIDQEKVQYLYTRLKENRKPKEMEKEAEYDVFISHASEDKVDFVEPLVKEMSDAGIVVWYDALEMQWGKSLREQIDEGIKKSKYAILVLSKNFFAKRWPQRELDGILAKQEHTGIEPLPIWYNITADEVYSYSPLLSGLYALSYKDLSIKEICEAFKQVLSKKKD